MSRSPRTPKGRTSRWTWMVAGGMVLFAVWFSWELFFPHRYEPLGGSLSDVRRITTLAPPADVRAIRVAEFRHFQEYSRYVRFEASPAECLHFAEEIAGQKLLAVDRTSLAHVARPSPAGAFSDLSWFDVAAGKNLVGAGGGPSIPSVWVDLDRGIFYFHDTD